MGNNSSKKSTNKPFPFGPKSFKYQDVNPDEFIVLDPSLKPSNPILKDFDNQKAFSRLTEKQNLEFESFSDPDKKFYCGNLQNQFIETLHTSFQNHYPLILTPDDIWLLITQGLSRYINENSEKVKKVFVSHSGKKKIIVELPEEFVPKRKANDWGSVINVFSEKIEHHIGSKVHKLIVSDFTTTGPLQKIVSELVLMETMKSYFEYECWSSCGIPSIKLEGTLRDWENIFERTQNFLNLIPDLEWWLNPLLLVLEQFIMLKNGKYAPEFWISFYKDESKSEGRLVTGYANLFFPYLENSGIRKNNFLYGPPIDDCPSSLSVAPFTWMPLNIKMKFVGGFVGTSQDPETLALRTHIAWGVAEDKNSEEINS